MKLLLITAVAEFEKEVKQILKKHKLKPFLIVKLLATETHQKTPLKVIGLAPK